MTDAVGGSLFSKVSALVSLLYTVTIWITFENFCLFRVAPDDHVEADACVPHAIDAHVSAPAPAHGPALPLAPLPLSKPCTPLGAA